MTQEHQFLLALLLALPVLCLPAALVWAGVFGGLYQTLQRRQRGVARASAAGKEGEGFLWRVWYLTLALLLVVLLPLWIWVAVGAFIFQAIAGKEEIGSKREEKLRNLPSDVG